VGLKNTFFCYFKGFLGVKKFFGRRIRVFQSFLPLEMMFLEKKFLKKCPQKLAKFSFFWGTLYKYRKNSNRTPWGSIFQSTKNPN
jgi:hypothetical protein